MTPSRLPLAENAGRLLLAAAALGVGLQSIFYAKLPPELVPVPASVPGQSALAICIGLLLAGSVSALLMPSKARFAAISLLAQALLCFTLLQLPKLISNLANGGAWTTAFEILAIASAFAVIGGYQRLGRLGYGLSLPVFGVLHVVYAGYIVSVIPGWLPGATFWAYFTAAAHVAAGLSLIAGIQVRLASTLLTVMFGSWVLILHLPRVIASSGARAECTSLYVAMAFCGGALLIAQAAKAQRSYPAAAWSPRSTDNMEIDPPSMPLTGKLGVSSGSPAPSTYNSGK